MAALETHSSFPVAELPTWVLHPSHQRGRRLVVFVHGFGGRAVATWTEFPQSGQMGSWWEESDMLFVGYKSMRENITSVADRLRTELPRFYPIPYSPAMNVGGVRARDDIVSAYEELILVGHSLGGLVIRIALAKTAQEWLNSSPPQGASLPDLLNAQTRFFSPASAGFRPAGALGLISAAGVWPVIEMFLRTSSAFSDMNPQSTLITNTRRTTERLAGEGFSSLRARTLWANPDGVVLAEDYDTDLSRASADRQSHGSVCKPSVDYPRPWQFVETGR
jgi:pimeloyl-ACP methyl ester carboxylesterase